MKPVRCLLLVFPAVLLFTSGCGKQTNRLSLATIGAPQTFNPLLATDAASDQVVRMIFAPLVSMDLVAQEPSPALAESWSVEADQKTWTFKLRKGLRWSDGQPLTAADVVFTWNEIMYNPQMNQLTYELFRVDGKPFSVTKLDAQTVRVVTPGFFAPFIEFFGGVPILPEHILGPVVRERFQVNGQTASEQQRFLSVYSLKTPPERIVGSGPFRIKEYLPRKMVLLERNPEYWAMGAQNRRLPYFDQVQLTTTTNTGAAALLFLNGKCDVFEGGRPDDYAQVKRAAASGKTRLIELGVGTERDFLWFNLNTNLNAAGKPVVNPTKLNWFRNKKFRQAVSCAIDRDRLVREVYAGRAQAIHAFIAGENQKWNNPNVPRFAYDPARARTLLAEIGLQDRDGDGVLEDAGGAKVEIIFNSNSGNPSRARCAAFIAEDLRKLGFKVDFQLVDFRLLTSRINDTFDYECILMGLGGGGTDPASQANVLKASEPMHQWFPNQKTPASDWEARIDWLMDAQMRTLDFAERKKYFDEVQAILAEELPMIYTVSAFYFAAVRSDLANLRPSVLTPYHVTWNVQELYFKKP